MAAPTLFSAGSGRADSNTTTHAINFPTNVAGQLLLVYFGTDGVTSSSLNTGGPWTKVYGDNSGANSLHVYAKVANGTTDSGITGSMTTNASEQSTHRVVAIENWEGTIAGGLNVAAVVSTAATNVPDPPLATDGWGSVDRKTVAVQCCDGGKTTIAFPSGGYTLNQFSDDGGNSNVGMAQAGLNSEPGDSQNPAPFTISGTDQWIALTVSIRGAVSVAPPQTFFVPFLHDDLWLYTV